MDLAICDAHGQTGVTMVCVDASPAIWDRIPPCRLTRIEVDRILLPVAWVCDDCLMRWRTPEDETPRDAAKTNAFLDGLRPVCAQCFDEVTAAGY